MTVSSGDRAAQSGHRARRRGRLMRKRELARSLATLGLAGLTGGAGVGEQVIGAGDELAGDRGGGDLLAAAAGEGLVAGSEVRVPLGGLRGLAQHPAHPGRPLLGAVPVVGRAWMPWGEPGGSPRGETPGGPTPLQHPAGRPWPWSARTAWIRLRSSVRSRTSCAR